MGIMESEGGKVIASVSGKPDFNRRGDRAVSKVDRHPPHSEESEKGVLGCLLLDNACMDEAVLRIGDKVKVFYDLRHQTIFEAMLRVRAKHQSCADLITMMNELKAMKLLEQIGDVTYLSELQDFVPSAGNMSYYLDHVCERYLLRTMLQTCQGIASELYEYTGPAETLLDCAEREILAISQTFARGRGGVDLASVQNQLIALYESAMGGQVAGLVTDFRDLDHKLGGCMPQELIIIGGTPSAGKTTLAMNIAYNVACRGNMVSFKSLETSATKMVHRLHCYAGKVDSSGFLRGQATELEMQKMVVAVDLVAKQRDRILISDEAMTDAKLLASCRQDYQKGARLFVVDMLQNIQAKGDSEFAIVTNASKCLKNIAKELNVPVIGVSSLSRMETDKSGKVRRPTMHDVRQSGQIESDADKMILLHAPEREGDLRQVTGIIAKNKDGPLGDVAFTFFSNQFRFESAEIGGDEPYRPHAD